MPRELKRSLPLYAPSGFRERTETQGYAYGLPVQAPHPGLVFDKFIDTWRIEANGCWAVQKPGTGRDDSRPLKLGSKRAWLEETIARYKEAKETIATRLTLAHHRYKQLREALGGEPIEMVTDWRFVSGLGNGHPFETGFIWHRTLGVPYLPGSAVKGLLRAWVKPVNEGGWSGVNAEEWTDDVKRLFGDTNGIGAGRLIVFDAIPTKLPELEVDVMNPHYGEYYQKPVQNPPADYLSPKPVFFLTVKAGQEFLFSLAPRPGAYHNNAEGIEKKQVDLNKGKELLAAALETIGGGGKTAVGYGVFQRPQS